MKTLLFLLLHTVLLLGGDYSDSDEFTEDMTPLGKRGSPAYFVPSRPLDNFVSRQKLRELQEEFQNILNKMVNTSYTKIRL